MQKISYSRHRFPPLIIQYAIWLYFNFSLSYRDVEDLLAERGIDVSYETVRRWVLKFGSVYARKLNLSRPRPNGQWHLDEVLFLSTASDRICGGRLMVKVRCWKFWFKLAETDLLR